MADISLRLKLEDADKLKSGLQSAKDELVALKKERDELSESWKKGNVDIADSERNVKKELQESTKELERQERAVEEVNKQIKDNTKNVNDAAKANKDYADQAVLSGAQAIKAIENERVYRQQIVKDIKEAEKSIKDLEKQQKNLTGSEWSRVNQEINKAKREIDGFNTQLKESDEDVRQLSRSAVEFSFGTDKFHELSQSVANSKNELEALKVIYDHLNATPADQMTSGMAQTLEGIKQAMAELGRPEKIVTVRTELAKVRDEMQRLVIAGQNYGDEWDELVQKADTLKLAVRDVAYEESKIGRHDQGVRNAIAYVNELVAVFGIAQGAMALFGKDSDDMQKALVKLNGVIAILNSLTVIQTNLFRNDSLIKKSWTLITQTATWATNGLTLAQRALRVALLATGIGAVIVLLGLLAEKLFFASSATDDLAKQNEKITESAAKELASLQSLRAGIEDVNRTQEQRLASVEKLQKQYPALFGNLEKEKILAGEVAGAWDLATKAIIAKATASVYEEKLQEQIKESIKLEGDYRRELEKRIKMELEREQGGFFAPTSSTIDGQLRIEEAYNKRLLDSKISQLEISNNIVKKQDEYNAILGVTEDSIKSIGGASSQINNDITSFINRLQDISIENISDDYERDLAKMSLANERAIADLANEFQAIESLGMATPEIVAQYQQAISDLADTQAKELIELSKKYEDERIALENEANNILLQIRGQNLQIELNELEESYNKRFEVLQKAGLETNELIEQLKNDQLAIIRKYDLEEIKAIEEGSLRKIKIIEKSSLNEAAKKEIINRITLEAQKKAINDSAALVQSNVKITYDALMQYIEAFAQTGGSISIVDFFGEELSPEDIALLENLIEKTAKTIKEGASKQSVFDAFFTPEGFDIKGGLFALMATDNEQMNRALKSSLDQISQYSKDIFNSIYDAQRSTIEKEMNLIDERIAKLEESLNRQRQIVSEEQKLYEEGYANNYKLEQDRLRNLEDVKKEELRAKEEAFEKVKKIEIAQAELAWATSAAQQVADTAATVTSLVRGAAQTTAAHSGIPFVGVALGLASAAALIAGFVSMRKRVEAIKSSSMGNPPSFGQGGGFALDGERSHANGGVNLMASDGRVLANYEGNEFLYAVKKSESKKDKYLPFLQAINAGNDDMIKNISLGFIGNEDLNKTTEKSINVNTVKFATQVDNASLRDIAHSNKEMLNLEKNKEFVTETNGMIIKKKGNTTFKIMKK